MTIFSEFGSPGRSRPLLNAQSFALEHLVLIHATTLDLRWAMVELLLRSLTAMCVLAQGQLGLAGLPDPPRQAVPGPADRRC